MATRQFLDKGLWERLMMEVTTKFKLCFPLIFIFFEVVLMSRIDGKRRRLGNYILFIFDVCFHFLHSYVRVLLLRNFGFSDKSLFNFIYFFKFLLVFSWIWLRHAFKEKIDQQINQVGDNVRSFFIFIFTNDSNYPSFHTFLFIYIFN